MYGAHEVNCSTGEVTKRDFFPEEILQHELERQLAEQQALLDSLMPSQNEIDQAEFELRTLNLLMEVGLI